MLWGGSDAIRRLPPLQPQLPTGPPDIFSTYILHQFSQRHLWASVSAQAGRPEESGAGGGLLLPFERT